MKNKNMIILIGLLFLWIMIVRLRSSISSLTTAKNPTTNTQSNSTNESTANDTATNESTANDTATNVEKPTTQRVEVSKSLAKNTKTLYDNIDLSPYGRSYTS